MPVTSQASPNGLSSGSLAQLGCCKLACPCQLLARGAGGETFNRPCEHRMPAARSNEMPEKPLGDLPIIRKGLRILRICPRNKPLKGALQEEPLRSCAQEWKLRTSEQESVRISAHEAQRCHHRKVARS